jgi:hypothetical protein
MKQRKWTLMEQATFLKRIGELLARGYPVAEATTFTDTIKKSLCIKGFKT